MSKRVAQSGDRASHINNNQLGAIMENHTNLQNTNSKGIAKARQIGLAGFAAMALSGALGAADPVSAQTLPDKPTYDLPAGLACPFRLLIYIAGEQPVNKVFKDKDGDPVRYLLAGRGTTNTLVNGDTGASITLKPSGGSVSRGTVNQDGTLTYVATGFNTISWFPSDVPAGPSTILYIGRVVYTVDPNTGTFTLVGTSGKQTDICATLSSTM